MINKARPLHNLPRIVMEPVLVKKKVPNGIQRKNFLQCERRGNRKYLESLIDSG
jgi:hypothetical protein